jgi:hypothetical protein
VSVISEIEAERKRQIGAEGWTPEHDDEHKGGQLAGAAACYAIHDIKHWAVGMAIQNLWPWSRQWLKPTDNRRNLIKAAALIVAEIERSDRAMLAASEPQEGDR